MSFAKKTLGIVGIICTIIASVVVPITTHAKNSDKNGCSINSATFSPGGDQTKNKNLPPSFTLTINSSNCVYTTIGINIINNLSVAASAVANSGNIIGNVAIGSLTGGTGGALIGGVASIQQLNGTILWSGYREIGADTATLVFPLNESICNFDIGADCLLSVVILSEGGLEYNTEEELGGSFFNGSTLRNDQRVLAYECNGFCDTNGSNKLPTVPLNDSDPNNGFIKRSNSGELLNPNNINSLDTSSPCYDAKAGAMMEQCNALLAPLPGLTKVDSSVSLGEYVNIIVRIGIGLVIVAAVVSMIISGFEYMTAAATGTKANAKKKLLNAVLGMLVALGMFTILTTINPNLINLQPGISAVSIGLDPEEEGDGNADIGEDSLPPNYTSRACPEGYTLINGITVCRKVAQNLEKMVADAKNAGIALTGFSFRSPEKQISLRKKNCGPTEFDIYKKPSGKCTPPTAVPGASRHENGLAIDFGVNRKTICYSKNPNPASCTDPAYIWLKNNAKKYGFYNTTKEPWHWSIDGK